jgi:hypothetical protein
MTQEEFVKVVLSNNEKKYSQKEIEVYYDTSVKLFDYMFEKWKKEKFSTVNS